MDGQPRANGEELMNGFSKKSSKKRRYLKNEIEGDAAFFNSLVSQFNEIKKEYDTTGGEDEDEEESDSIDREGTDSYLREFSGSSQDEAQRQYQQAHPEDAIQEDNEEPAAAPAAQVEFNSEWTGGVEGVGAKIEKEKDEKKSKKKKTDDDDGNAVTSIPHKKASLTMEDISMQQLRIKNMRVNHGIIINPEDEIDLENTSCSSEDEDDHRHDDDDDEDFFVGKRPSSKSEDYGEDPLDEFEHGDLADDKKNDIAQRLADRAKRRQKKRKHEGDSVANDMGRMNNCFLCKWGKRTYDSVNNEHMSKLLRLLHENLGEIPLQYIALTMHNYYKTVIRPAGLTRGQRLPPWKSKHVYICLLTHNQIPEIRLVKHLSVIDTMQEFLMRKVAMKSADSKDDIPIRQLIKEYNGCVALEWKLRAQPMQKMNFYRADRDIKLGGERQFFAGLSLKKNNSKAGAPLAILPGSKKQK